MKRQKDWTLEDSEATIAKYTRVEDAEELVDPLLSDAYADRQGFLVAFMQNTDAAIERYTQRLRVAQEGEAAFMGTAEVNSMFQTRGRVIRLPVALLDDDGKPLRDDDGEKKNEENAATKDATPDEAPASETTSSSSSSSSDSSSPVEPSADAPPVVYLDNSTLRAQLETLTMESSELHAGCSLISEWLAFRPTSLSMDMRGEENRDLAERLLEQVAAARDMAGDRYEFLSTYLEFRAGIERNMRRYPDVQAYRELMVAREHAAWEELVRSWRLLISALATLSTLLRTNLKHILHEDNTAQEAEASLYM